MPSEVILVEIEKEQGRPLGISGVEVPWGAGILVTALAPHVGTALRPGDRIYGVNGNWTRTLDDLMTAAVRPPHDKATILIGRTTVAPEIDIPLLFPGTTISPGAEVGADGRVTKADAQGNLNEGDHILEVGGKVWDGSSQLPPVPVQLLIRRRRIPAHLEHLVSPRRNGFDYFIISFDPRIEGELGFGVGEWNRRVIITFIQAGTLAQRQFLILDRILVWNGRFVQGPIDLDTDGAENGVTWVIVERPASVAAQRQLIDAFTPPKLKEEPWPEFCPPADIQEITPAAVKASKVPTPLSSRSESAPKGILLQPAGPRTQHREKEEDPEKAPVTPRGRVKVRSIHQSVRIHRDTDPTKKLSQVPRRYS